MTNKILIAVPCFNEEANVSKVVTDLRKISQADICVINDGSTDSTLEIIQEIKGLDIISFPVNLGISETLRVAALKSLREGYSYLIQCDGDGQHDSNGILQLIESANEKRSMGFSDFVIVGSRFLTGYQMTESTTRLRIYGSKILRFMLLCLYRIKSTDPTSGLRLYSGKTIRYLSLCYPTIWPETVFLGRLQKSAFPIHETQVSMNQRAGGESKLIGFKSLAFMVKVCLALIVDKFFWRGNIEIVRSLK